MEKVTLKDTTFKTFIPYEKISAAIDDVAAKINSDFRNCDDVPVLLCVLNGSIMFMAELMKRLTFPLEGTNTTGKVKQAIVLPPTYPAGGSLLWRTSSILAIR